MKTAGMPRPGNISMPPGPPPLAAIDDMAADAIVGGDAVLERRNGDGCVAGLICQVLGGGGVSDSDVPDVERRRTPAGGVPMANCTDGGDIELIDVLLLRLSDSCDGCFFMLMGCERGITYGLGLDDGLAAAAAAALVVVVLLLMLEDCGERLQSTKVIVKNHVANYITTSNTFGGDDGRLKRRTGGVAFGTPTGDDRGSENGNELGRGGLAACVRNDCGTTATGDVAAAATGRTILLNNLYFSVNR